MVCIYNQNVYVFCRDSLTGVDTVQKTLSIRIDHPEN